jgi:hypothetical protein
MAPVQDRQLGSRALNVQQLSRVAQHPGGPNFFHTAVPCTFSTAPPPPTTASACKAGMHVPHVG